MPVVVFATGLQSHPGSEKQTAVYRSLPSLKTTVKDLFDSLEALGIKRPHAIWNEDRYVREAIYQDELRVTDKPSVYSGKDLQINERELFASWHARWMEEHGGRREEKPTVINGKLKYGTVAVEFKRMTRMSKGSTESPMPPEQHLELEVPVYDLAQYVDTERLDSRATKHVVFPLGRHEAMKMDLFGDTESEPTAMRLYVEGVNGISGKPVDNTQHKLSFSQGGTQDHVVVPTQPSINGYVAKSNSARQFTQMSLKLGLDTLDSLKETDTSHDLQLEFIPSHGTTGFSFIATNLWSPGKIRQAPQNLDARKSPMEYGITNNKHLSLEHSGRPALLSDLIFTPRDPWDELAGYRENIAHVRASYPSGDFKVTLINMNGKALTVRTPYTYTVTKLKQLIETVHYIPANEQILILEGRRLLDAMYLMDYELNPHSIIELHRQPHIHPDFLPPTPQSPGFPVFPPTRKQSSDDSHTRLRIWKDKNDPGIYDMAAATTVKVYPVHPALFEALTGIKVKGRASLIPVRSSGERRLSEASIENETCCRCTHRRSEYRLRPCQHSCCHECLAEVLSVSPPEKNCWTCQAVVEGIH